MAQDIVNSVAVCGENHNCTSISIDARDADIIVKYPLNNTEFEIQSSLYQSLCRSCEIINQRYELQYTVKSEVTIYIDKKIGLRFDLMLFDNITPICGIEVKKRSNLSSEQNKKQKIRYEMFERLTGIPVLYCRGMKEVSQTVSNVEEYLK